MTDPALTSAAPDRLIEFLGQRRTVALTGAGMSTDSGIPDYRGPGSPPRTPISFQQFTSDPGFRRRYWARNHIGWRHFARTEPNAGHLSLAALERSGHVSGVITQNVDRLHRAAGTRALIELHGHFERVVCLSCPEALTRAELHDRLTALNPDFDDTAAVPAPDADATVEDTRDFVVAACEACGGVLKPDIVYFGENVPPERVAQAYDWVDRADALLVLGSSLTVFSGRRFVRHAVAQGKPVAIVNRGRTREDERADLVLDAGLSEVLSAVCARV